MLWLTPNDMINIYWSVIKINEGCTKKPETQPKDDLTLPGFLHITIANVLHVYILYNRIPNRSSDKLMYGQMPITQEYITPMIAYARSVCRGISESRSAQTSL